ncbi:hypothetical protein HCN44_000374 [Aphidius gifuensis]|uniref:Uncharacterized protein n=1 Tax=Aphidius gifuensis TaxID=684658 RepID=A0A835CN86_APHGI|nr:hypothetical protein HCN44_000374 [Aphidius gifuensis]
MNNNFRRKDQKAKTDLDTFCNSGRTQNQDIEILKVLSMPPPIVPVVDCQVDVTNMKLIESQAACRGDIEYLKENRQLTDSSGCSTIELIIQQEPAQQLQHTKPEPQQKIPQQPLVLGIQQELQKQQEQLTPTPTHQEEIPQYPPALEIQEVIPQEQEQPIPAPQQEIPQYPLTLGIQEELPQEQEQPIPAPQQEIPQNLLALEIQEQLPQQHEQPIPEPQREIPQHPLALGIQEELPQQHEQPIPEPQREIKQHNEVEIVVENVHFPAEPQHESQLYGQNYDRDTC